MVAGIGEGSEEPVVVGDIDFQGYSDPDTLAEDMSAFTTPVTYSELITQEVSERNRQAIVDSANDALKQLGNSAVEFACTEPCEGICQAPAAALILGDVTDAYFKHIFTQGEAE
jgi:hypothetical protein